jgi:VanZ family protein
MPARESGPGVIPHVDKLIHFGMFAGFSLLWMNARPPWPRGRTWWAAVLGAALVLAVVTEVAQGLPAVNRDPDPLDGLADAFGAFVAVGAISATARKPPDDRLGADDPGTSKTDEGLGDGKT